ncbi:MAG: 3-phosphoshikimate 1-carboxyvinyltransferase, partial [Actinomycetota bacterium]|nr:3-phosphoshikimate 1-carboxyvinyltransferase [Actinomycetota bacterium]
MADQRRIDPAGGVFKTGVRIPGDKSLSHRALVFASLAESESEITGLAPGLDVATTADALARLGMQRIGDRFSAAERMTEPDGPVDCGNSGTTMRLLSGSLAAAPFRVTLTGDSSLRSRPMGRLVEPLGALGVDLGTEENGTAPITTGGAALAGADVTIDVASAQVRTAFEIAAIQAEGSSTIDSPAGFRDHTERWLETFGLGTAGEGTKMQILPGRVPGARYDIPGDPSSAAYLWASAALLDGAHVVTPGISLNPGRLGFLTIIEAMGATVHGEVTGSIHGDVVGTMAVTGGPLQAVEVFGD